MLYNEDQQEIIDQDDIQIINVNGELNQLNEPISETEVRNSIIKLGNGKSPGTDGISAEFYKETISQIAPTLTTIINTILNTGVFLKSWGESVICPIHKSGSHSDPSNYRGISLLNTMYKIVSTIINNRLYIWAEENNEIDEGQAGFRRGYATVDNIFNLQAMVQKYISQKGDRFYCIYIDFQKAFDKIRHNVLFRSLKQKGVICKFCRFLKLSYSDHNSCVNKNVTYLIKHPFSNPCFCKFFLFTIFLPTKQTNFIVYKYPTYEINSDL